MKKSKAGNAVKARAKTKTKAKATDKAGKKTRKTARPKAKAEVKERPKAKSKARPKSAKAGASPAEMLILLAKAEKKLARAKEKAKTEHAAGTEAALKLKAESEKQHRIEAQSADVIKSFKQIRRYLFLRRAIKRNLAFISALVIISAIAISVSVFKGPRSVIGEAAAVPETTPAGATDMPANIAGVDDGMPVVNPFMPGIKRLTVVDGYDQRTITNLSEDGKTNIVRSSDNTWLEIGFDSYTSYDFSDIALPVDAVITSVIVCIEHFEEERFAEGKLEWSVGTGWPLRPEFWASVKAPVHEGQFNEPLDFWDVTNIVDTREKINDLQLQIKNNNIITTRKTFIDCVYVVVEWE